MLNKPVDSANSAEKAGLKNYHHFSVTYKLAQAGPALESKENRGKPGLPPK
ncbi:hypothetical protein SJA_C1-08230 [Sphingobium indicum UT26S]|uniref:Uncharacterized protein n=1 Tax=Sphingobium indicum (strain DSM 16413 / CCM 7287 / MTCC 6362 / UT26 / NBRC 101211 / UT26S) TaxID=452662 RepID=D4YZ75_SPHIU|nr:hypothetical protein SJA_C1-08230 [Sphingobium indicum UT26S]